MDNSTAIVLPLKTCSQCAQLLPLSRFSRASWCVDGHRGQCKACRAKPKRPAIAPVAKTCTGCGVAKPIGEFQKRSATPDGFHNRCKVCRKAEKAAAYIANREQIRAKNTAWYWANRNKSLQAVQAWQSANLDKRRSANNRRRARKSGSFVGPIELDLLAADSCGICGQAMLPHLVYPDPMSRSLDHIVPLALGGAHEQSNLQWTHLRCNIKKGARPTP